MTKLPKENAKLRWLLIRCLHLIHMTTCTKYPTDTGSNALWEVPWYLLSILVSFYDICNRVPYCTVLLLWVYSEVSFSIATLDWRTHADTLVKRALVCIQVHLCHIALHIKKLKCETFKSDSISSIKQSSEHSECHISKFDFSIGCMFFC